MSSATIVLCCWSSKLGFIHDTLLIASDDPTKPDFPVTVSASIVPYFRIADNEDSLSYVESGSWHFSNAQASGTSSRYSFLTDSPGAFAQFNSTLQFPGSYEVFEIVPVTTNAANKALYVVSGSGHPMDSVYVDQNIGSGAWMKIGIFNFPAHADVSVKVMNTGVSTSGSVLRADGIKFAIVQDAAGVGSAASALPSDFALSQNFPNPFNPSTEISYALPVSSTVRLRIFDLLGRVVAVLENDKRSAGFHRIQWDAHALSAGIYFYRIEAVSVADPPRRFVSVKKMVLLR